MCNEIIVMEKKKKYICDLKRHLTDFKILNILKYEKNLQTHLEGVLM